jgi:dipeptidyl aminopeptidase/acylaminoacyl peptidase
VERGGAVQDQRFATDVGAIPYINLSFAMVEHAFRQVLAGGSTESEVPFLLVSNGQTFTGVVRLLAPDSASLSMAGVEMFGIFDEAGRMLRASVPSQNVTVTRVASPTSAEMTEAAPDYSAPVGAPYAAEEVVIETPAGIVLAGTLTIPEGDGPWPAVVLITGSGSQDRDETIRMVRGYKPLRQIADTLSRRGIAVLRVDDRGIGGSDVGPPNPTSADFADDVRAEVAYLRSRPDIDGARVGLAGHSEGGIIAPIVASTDPSIAAIALLAGTSRNGREILEYQNHELIYGDPAVAVESRDSLYDAALTRLDSIAGTEGWLSYFMTYEPLPTAREVTSTCVLILQGETDRQVTADQAPELEAAFQSAGNEDVTVIVYPDVNHLFLDDPDGAVSGYSRLEDTSIPPYVLGELADWFTVRLGSS